MNWIKIIMYYILIGTAISIVYDTIQKYLVKKEELQFNNWERLLIITSWPIIMLQIFIKVKRRK